MSGFRPDRPTDPQALDVSLEALARRYGLDGVRASAAVFAHWEEIVGPAMAEHVQPVRVEPEALVVTCDHPAWATQVRRLADQVLDRVAEECGVVRPARLEVRIGR